MQYIMKKITLLLLFLASTTFQMEAQTTFDGSQAYGRMTNFVYDATVQNRIYASTLGKHIMVSEDNGLNWTVFYTLPYFNYDGEIKNLRLTKNNTALSFAEFYAPGSSLNRITVIDLQTKQTIRQYNMPSIAVTSFNDYSLIDNEALDTLVYLSKGDGEDKVVYTHDGGTNWSIVFDATDHTGVLINDVQLDPNNGQRIFIARNNGPGAVKGGLLISNDGGQSWTETLSGLILQSVAINPANSNDIFAGSGVLWTTPAQSQALYRSLDGGATWTSLPITWEQWSDIGPLKNFNGYIFNAGDPNNIIILEEDQILITHDNGATWENNVYPGGPVPEISHYYYGTGGTINPFNNNDVFINNGMYPLKSVDGGTTTTIVPNPFFTVTGDVNIVDMPAQEHLYYGARWGYIHRDQQTNIETPTDVLSIGEVPNGQGSYRMYTDAKLPGRVYTYTPGFSGNLIQVSDDHGTTKTDIYTTYQGLFAACTDPTTPTVGWFSFFDGVNAYLRKIDFTDVNNVVVTEITLPENEDYLQALHIDASGTIRMTVGNKMYRSTDSGTTWTAITDGLEGLELPNIGIKLVQNPMNAQQFSLAASDGIYTSVDNGDSWTKIYDGFVNTVNHSDKTNGHIVAVVQTTVMEAPKVLYSSDGGINWNQNLSATLYDAIISSSAVKFHDETADVYLASSDLGLLKQTVSFSTLGTPGFENPTATFALYPNPSRGTVTVKWPNGNSAIALKVYSITGQEVMTTVNQDTLDISRLSNGVYLVKATDTSGNTTTQRLIKY